MLFGQDLRALDSYNMSSLPEVLNKYIERQYYIILRYESIHPTSLDDTGVSISLVVKCTYANILKCKVYEIVE